jgi:tRNA-specific 2-thiouridylase
MQHGAQLVATGHYAQTKDGLLYEGEDTEKDQSYFLWAVPYEVLCNTLFPIGGMRKIQVRSYAKKIGLPNDNRKDSQGLCFLGPVSIDDMLRNELLLSAGMVVNEEGEILGTHEGVEAYTLGQRHGFTLVPHTEDMKPHFVIGKDIVRNTLIVSTERFPTSTKTTRVSLKEVNWIGERSGSDVEARYRYRQKRIPVLYKDDAIVLTEPHYVPLGQSLVIYEGRRCLGGGIVEKSELL